MELRPYQQEAREAVKSDWASGFLRTLLVLPTGCGKTIVFSKIVEDVYAVRGVERPELISPAKLRGGQRVTKVTQTTKDNIRDIVTRCIEQGTSREDMAAEILQEYEIDCKSRARLIADQETAMCLEQGHYDMMKASGAKWKAGGAAGHPRAVHRGESEYADLQ